MSFRDNLQHLRSTRHMTQEQLAMLLGVSRQSVTKWESEKSYPEMDKLLAICRIFDVSLDDLVNGDLTTVEPDPSTPVIPDGPATDICGYDEHMRRRANRVSAGVGLFILGVAVCVIMSAFLEGLGDTAETVPAVAMFVCIAAGLALIIPASAEHESFKKAHPFVEDFYTPSEKEEAGRARGKGVAAGIVTILVGLCFPILGSETGIEDLLAGVFLLFVAVGTWMIVRSSMLAERTDLSAYNKEALDDATVDDIERAQLDPSRRDALLSSKNSRKRSIKSATYTTIMLVATIIALVWLFSPMFSGGTFDDVNTVAQQSLFWLPWVIGGISCAIASALIDLIVKD
jgi:transcriptional regulator with XRE-family HTH domain